MLRSTSDKVAAKSRAPAPADLPRDQLLAIYYYLRLTRSLEERLSSLYRQGKVIGGLYRSLGQEGESVATAYALEEGDVLSPLIRNLGAMLVKGARPVEVFRQYMAKATSPTRGREMNIHFNDLKLEYLGQISHLGDMVPVMAGVALTFKMNGEPRVGMVYVGDGATSTGAFHEGANFAAVQKVPLVVIVESNGYAFSTPTDRQTKVANLAERAKAYGVPGYSVDGNDVIAVYQIARRLVREARQGEGMRWLEVLTYRRKGHAEHDDQRYQPQSELAQWEAKDPIDRYVGRLLGESWATDEELSQIDQRVGRELDDALEVCENDPLPEGQTARGGVFSENYESGRLWFEEPDG